MSKPIIFDLRTKKVIPSVSFNYEKELQKIIEENMENIFAVRFLKSEYKFSDTNDGNGRIDSLGIDQENRPVIFEYKLSQNENVINQSLYYMSWLSNHKGDFEMLVLEKFGKQAKEMIQWKPRAICVANEFDKYSDKAISSVGADVTLIKYYLFGKENNLIAFESTNSIFNKKIITINDNAILKEEISDKKEIIIREGEQFASVYNSLPQTKKDFIDWVSNEIVNLSDEIMATTLTRYRSFRRVKCFSSLVIRKSGVCYIYASIPYTLEMKNNKLIEDYSNKGHWGIGDTRFIVNSIEEFNDIFKYIKTSFELN